MSTDFHWQVYCSKLGTACGEILLRLSVQYSRAHALPVSCSNYCQFGFTKQVEISRKSLWSETPRVFMLQSIVYWIFCYTFLKTTTFVRKHFLLISSSLVNLGLGTWWRILYVYIFVVQKFTQHMYPSVKDEYWLRIYSLSRRFNFSSLLWYTDE